MTDDVSTDDISRGAGARLAPLQEAEWDDFLRRLVDATGGPERALNIFTTLGRHPKLFRAWITFGGALLSGTLTARRRELAILRTSVHCGADYEWAHHVDAARVAAVTDEELAALRVELSDGPWSEEDRSLLGAVDELHETNGLTDATWEEVHALLGDVGTIELVMLVGQYHLVAMALRTLRIQDEHRP
ncbi:MAG: carboxymuconolactone decarboxylase family protein [Acidimicrobiales bacterium]